MAFLIDGKKISSQIKDELKTEIAEMKKKGTEVTLAVIQVGNDPASSVYVGNKKKACAYIGIRSLTYELPESTTEMELLTLIDELNNRKDVNGIIQLLKRSNIDIDGKECVVVGRSNIVGKPMAILLLRENATVTICHSHTKDLKEVCKRADILVAAIGKPKFFNRDYIKEGAVVIDVGIHRNEQNKLCGDVDRDDVMDFVSAITPVPGGVGPMTIAMLMYNCVEAVRLQKTER